jgi:hypothetical protein
MQVTFVATPAFPTSSVPAMIMTFGSAYGYSPTSGQTALHGTALYQTPVPVAGAIVSPGVVMYSFVIATTVSAPFNFGEMLLTSPDGSLVYSIGVLENLLNRVTGESVEVSVFFNVTTDPVSMFGYTSSSTSATILPYLGPVSNLAPVDLNASAGNIFLVQSPVNAADSMLVYASYQRASIANDFDSWSLENYVLVGEGLTSGVSGGSVVLPITVTPLTFVGQYIFQTDGYVRAPSAVSVVSGYANVALDSPALAMTPANTPYKIYQYTGSASQAETFVGQLTVTPAQINAIAALTASLVFLSDGSRPMTGPLNAGTLKVINAADATDPTDLVNYETMTSTFGLSEVLLEALSNSVASLTATLESVQANVDNQVAINASLSDRITHLGG